ncbi:MAG: hypothetical protein ACLFU9_00900 [Candidatus Bathyarchaeia archaeon]
MIPNAGPSFTILDYEVSLTSIPDEYPLRIVLNSILFSKPITPLVCKTKTATAVTTIKVRANKRFLCTFYTIID